MGWHKINALVRAWAGIVAERRRSERCRVLLVDETSIRRRHRYVTVIVNADTGQTLAMVPHRSSAALSAFFAQQGHKWCKQVKVVVTDGSRAYRAAVDARLGHARCVLDRFHVIRWFCAGLTAGGDGAGDNHRHGLRRAPVQVHPSPVPASVGANAATGASRHEPPAADAARRQGTAGWAAWQVGIAGTTISSIIVGALPPLRRPRR